MEHHHDHSHHDHNHDHHGHHHHHHAKPNTLAIPIAIIIAGALIALAIYFSKSGSVAPSNAGAGTAQAVTIESAAKKAGINAKDLTKCIESDKYVTKINDSISEAQATGGSGTPWSIVVSASGKKYPLSGAQPIDKVKAIIDLALADGDITGADPKLQNLKPVTAADHIEGNINAPVKVVQFTDFDCPFCKRFHGTMEEIMASYGKENKVAWVIRNFPLTQLHPDAKNKAEAAECAAELGGNDKYWKLVDEFSKTN